jgi:hypothetical protein
VIICEARKPEFSGVVIFVTQQGLYINRLCTVKGKLGFSRGNLPARGVRSPEQQAPAGVQDNRYPFVSILN